MEDPIGDMFAQMRGIRKAKAPEYVTPKFFVHYTSDPERDDNMELALKKAEPADVPDARPVCVSETRNIMLLTPQEPIED